MKREPEGKTFGHRIAVSTDLSLRAFWGGKEEEKKYLWPQAATKSKPFTK